MNLIFNDSMIYYYLLTEGIATVRIFNILKSKKFNNVYSDSDSTKVSSKSASIDCTFSSSAISQLSVFNFL